MPKNTYKKMYGMVNTEEQPPLRFAEDGMPYVTTTKGDQTTIRVFSDQFAEEWIAAGRDLRPLPHGTVCVNQAGIHMVV